MMNKHNTKINKFGRKLLLTGSLLAATTIGNPMMGQNSQSKDPVAAEYVNHEDSLYNVLIKRYSEYNEETADKLAKKSTDAYLRLLDEGKIAEADSFMVLLHENFEKKEVAAARKKAYKIDPDDPEKLRTTKAEALAKYNACIKLEKTFRIIDAQREQMILEEDSARREYERQIAERDSIAEAQGVDPQSLPKIKPFRRSDKSISLDVKHSKTVTDWISAIADLAKLDATVTKYQLKHDKKRTKEALKQRRADLKEWNKLQEQIDAKQKQLDGLALSDYYKDKINEDVEHDKKVASQGVAISTANYLRNEQAKKVESAKAILENAQAKLGTKEDIEKEISELENKLNVIKDKLRRRDYTNEDFEKDDYENSPQQRAATGVKSDRGMATSEAEEGDSAGVAQNDGGSKKVTSPDGHKSSRNPQSLLTTSGDEFDTPKTATSKSNPILQQIRAVVVEKKEEFASTAMKDADIKTFDNGVIQTRYDMVGGEDAFILEYPNGKAAVIEGDTITVYNIDGHTLQYIKDGNDILETRDGEKVADSKVKTPVDILQILNASGHMRAR